MKTENIHTRLSNEYFNAQSNRLSMYEHRIDTNSAKYYLAERNIYGSSVLGTSRDTVNMMNPVTLPSYGIMGNRQYQLSEHRGNVLAVISDVKYPISSDNSTIDSYEVGIVNIADYSPFGVQLDGRTFENDFYRRSFQNQEHHDEIKGKGNYMNYKYRGYDPRIGRLDWTLDPLAPKYPELTPYQFSSNRVLDGVELEGLEVHTLNDDQELPNFDEAYKYNVGETFITPSGNFYENKEWHKGFHYKGFEDVTEDYTATINCNCPKEPSKFSKVVDDFRKWENKYFGEGRPNLAVRLVVKVLPGPSMVDAGVTLFEGKDMMSPQRGEAGAIDYGASGVTVGSEVLEKINKLDKIAKPVGILNYFLGPGLEIYNTIQDNKKQEENNKNEEK